MGEKLYVSDTKYYLCWYIYELYRNVILFKNVYVKTIVNMSMLAFKLLYKVVSCFRNIFFIKCGYAKHVVIILYFNINVYP